MTSEGNRPPETPDNFARTPDRDPGAGIEQRGDLPAWVRPNQALLVVMVAGMLLAVLLGVILFVAL